MAGSGVEKTLLALYAKELKAIEDGVVFVVAGATAEEDIYVYLQASLMYMHVDTRALESVTYSKGAGSSQCSCCNLNKGLHHPIMKKVTYAGVRNTASLDHLIRCVGELSFKALTEKDKVEDQNVKKKWEDENKRTKGKAGAYKPAYIVCSAAEHERRWYECEKNVYYPTIVKTDAFKLDDTPTEKLSRKLVNEEIGMGKIQYPDDVTTAEAKKAFIASRTWHNKLFPYDKMKKHMRFPFSDHREQLVWQHVDNETYCNDGAIGAAKLAKYEKDLAKAIAAGTRERPKTKHDASHNGRHDVCALMAAKLKSFGFDNVSFDDMHRGSNGLNYFISAMKGGRCVSDKDRKYAAATGKVPSLKYRNRLPEYELLDHEEKLCDAVINSLLISPWYKRDYAVKYPFQQTGFLKSHQCNILSMVYFPYMLSFTDLHENFQEFYARYAYDLKCYQNPCLDAEALREQFIPNIYETRMCQEGLFPESECVYIFHEIIDIIHHIEKYGHVRSLACYFGERAMGLIKSFVSKGGVHYMKTLYHRYVVKENSIAAQMTNNALYFTNHSVPKYSDFVLKLLGEGKTFDWHVNDKDDFFASLMTFVESQCIDRIHEKSPFFRLYKAFQDNMVEQNEPRQFCGFSSWIGGLNNIFLAGNILVREFTSHFVSDIPQTCDDFVFDDICNGYIFLSDFLAVKDSIISFNPVVHETLITKGILFNCRGHDYGALTGVMEGDRKLMRFGADLKNCWYLRKQYSSFVRITEFQTVVEGHVNEHQMTASGEYVGKKVPGTTPGAERFKRTSANLESDRSSGEGDEDSDSDELNKLRVFGEVVKFGQINSCWRISMPGDAIVDGLAFASVTLRKAMYNSRRRHYYIPETSMAYERSAQKFISVNYIDSTSIAVSPISVEGQSDPQKKLQKQQQRRQKQTDSSSVSAKKYRPMLKPEGAQSFVQYTDASRQSSGAYAKLDAVINELFMIELHPERLSYRYERIEQDVDGTKLWESV
jgi:hypothetical protein